MSILRDIIDDLKNKGELIVIDEEVDPNLEMAAIQLIAYAAQAPALFFPKVKGTRYPAVSNLFGTVDRAKYIFRKQWDWVQKAIALRNNPINALKSPWSYATTGIAALNALPQKVSWKKGLFQEIKISDLPQIRCWPQDGGAFITLPQVFTQDPTADSITHSNLGMYRIQISGNEYLQDQEIGLHYQIHRGIGIHHQKAIEQGKPLKVSIFVGGHPAHTLSAVMPLPESMSELVFAGMLAGRRFRYAIDPEGFVISTDADFVITGEVQLQEVKPEGPFGDHLGYYSLAHPFPVLKVRKVYAKKEAVWPFTVVGRPPQEDTTFGDLIHKLTGDAIRKELPGVKEVHAVDAAGVHPLLLAIGSERYTPYSPEVKPAEILTQAMHILGTGQLSLAKYLLITATHSGERLDIHQVPEFFKYILERIDWKRDLHFITSTTIDTLDYTGRKLNEGSKVIFAAYGPKKRALGTTIPKELITLGTKMVKEGILAISLPPYESQAKAQDEISALADHVHRLCPKLVDTFPLIVVCDQADELAATFDNFLWQTFTRSDPAQDIYGIGAYTEHKHWACEGSLIIDARMKPYMPPALEMDKQLEQRARDILARYWKGFQKINT